MQNREFYDLENGIHSMKIPRTGRYQLILAGYGYGDSKGAKIQMDMSFIKVMGTRDTENPALWYNSESLPQTWTISAANIVSSPSATYG